MKKILPSFDLYGNIISFSLGGLEFISTEDAKKFKKLNKNFALEEIKIMLCAIGTPRFVNLNKSIKNNKLIYYKDKEIQWVNQKEREKMDILNCGILFEKCPKCGSSNSKNKICCDCGQSLYIDCPESATISVEVPNGKK